MAHKFNGLKWCLSFFFQTSNPAVSVQLCKRQIWDPEYNMGVRLWGSLCESFLIIDGPCELEICLIPHKNRANDSHLNISYISDNICCVNRATMLADAPFMSRAHCPQNMPAIQFP